MKFMDSFLYNDFEFHDFGNINFLVNRDSLLTSSILYKMRNFNPDYLDSFLWIINYPDFGLHPKDHHNWWEVRINKIGNELIQNQTGISYRIAQVIMVAKDVRFIQACFDICYRHRHTHPLNVVLYEINTEGGVTEVQRRVKLFDMESTH
jgi:hypothetical protein